MCKAIYRGGLLMITLIQHLLMWNACEYVRLFQRVCFHYKILGPNGFDQQVRPTKLRSRYFKTPLSLSLLKHFSPLYWNGKGRRIEDVFYLNEVRDSWLPPKSNHQNLGCGFFNFSLYFALTMLPGKCSFLPHFGERLANVFREGEEGEVMQSGKVLRGLISAPGRHRLYGTC